MNDFQSPNQRYNPQQQQAWPPQNAGEWGSLQAQTAAQASVAERMGFIRKVYALFFAATLFAIGGVMLGLSFEPLLIFAFEHPFIMLLLMFGAVMGATAVRHVPVVNVVALFAFTTFTGLVISPLMYVVGRDNPASLVQAGLLTVGIFGGLTAYVFISKRDFSFLRGMLWTGLIIMI
ncbi:MAG TPA: Bax inhibitor-1 family protein, partial [Pyrinomonadaceae bacterium]